MKMQGIEKKSIMNFVFMLIAIVVMTTACKKDELVEPIDDNPVVELSGEKSIISFVFLQSKNIVLSNNVVGQINEIQKTITIVVSASTEITGLLPDVETSSTSRYSPSSVQDFTNPVEYTITAEDGSSVIYTVSVSVKKTEREVLQAILDANPSNTLGWNLSQTANLGDLGGVLLNVQGNIEKLALSYKSLTSVPVEIGNLVDLEYLSLEANSLTSVPSEIGNLVNLVQLNLNVNSLTSVPVEIGNLVSLIYLFLDNNSLTSVPVEIGNLVNLEELYLFNNSLTSIPSEIGFLHRLKELSIGENNLTNIPFAIKNLVNRNSLRLSGADGLPSSTTDKDVLIAMDLGSRLHWGVNNYEGVRFDSKRRVTKIIRQKKNIKFIPMIISTLTKLRVLYLDNNDIEKIPSTIGQITGLEVIGLSSNQIKTVPSQLGKLKNAVLMNLMENPIESIPSVVCDLQVSNGGKLTILTDPGEGCD